MALFQLSRNNERYLTLRANYRKHGSFWDLSDSCLSLKLIYIMFLSSLGIFNLSSTLRRYPIVVSVKICPDNLFTASKTFTVRLNYLLSNKPSKCAYKPINKKGIFSECLKKAQNDIIILKATDNDDTSAPWPQLRLNGCLKVTLTCSQALTAVSMETAIPNPPLTEVHKLSHCQLHISKGPMARLSYMFPTFR